MLCDELYSLKRREISNGDLEVITRKVADVHEKATNVVTGLHRYTMGSYEFI